MAADSIAKLAVIITGDASPLSAALQKAQADTQAFADRIRDPFQRGLAVMKAQNQESWLAGMERLKQQNANPFEALRTGAARFTAEMDRSTGAAFKMSMALQAARGNVGAISNLIQSGGMTGGLVAAGVAAGILAFKLAAISDAQKVAAGGTDTWAASWDKVEQNASRISVALGRPISNALARESEQLANFLGLIVHQLLPAWVLEEEKLIALNKQKAEQAAIDAKRKEDAAKKAAEEARLLGEELERQGREMESRADALARSLRTPREDFIAAMAEASQLFEAGFLSAQNYERAAEAAKQKFEEANKVRERAQVQATRGVGAAERFTTAGQSAVESGRRELERLAADQKRIVQQNEEAQRTRREQLDALNKFRPTVFQTGDL